MIFFHSMIICAVIIFGLVDGNKLSDFEIRTLTGEPNYKSVNLTWEIENTSISNSDESDSNSRNSSSSSSNSSSSNSINSSNNSTTVTIKSLFEFPKVFQIFYCEIQTFGPHRCRSKIFDEDDNKNDDDDYTNTIQKERADDLIKQYSTVIDNLRMATKYSFHIKPQIKRKTQQKNQRGMSEIRDNEIQTDLMGIDGQTIIIPTKGFSAVATKCLPHASEIEVETGPYFGGKIVVDGGNCGIKGNPKDLADRYVMVIDHEKCGSLVKPQTNTVETFITVQENLGIFTHSTRRFVVVCSFQSGMQTVRASFTIPGRGGIASVEENDPFEPDRNARSRQFRFVDRSGLVLKENYSENESNENSNIELKDSENDVDNSVAMVENILPGVNEDKIKETFSQEDKQKNKTEMNKIGNQHAKYSRLIGESLAHSERLEVNSGQNYPSNYTTGVAIATTLSVIMIGVFVYVLKREYARQITTVTTTTVSVPTLPTQRINTGVPNRFVMVNRQH